MQDWRSYHHRTARRGFALVSVGVGIAATLLDLGIRIATAGEELTPGATVMLVMLPFLFVSAFLLAALLLPRWRGPHALVTQTEAGMPAFAAVRSFSILSFASILVFWMLLLVERALSGRSMDDVPVALWFFVVVNAILCLGGLFYLWVASARRVVLTAAGLTVRRGLRTRVIAWDQIAEGGPRTPTHHTVGIMLWVRVAGKAAPEAYSLQDRHLSVSAALLAHAIRIYVRAPARRAQVGSVDELNRLMNELDPVHFGLGGTAVAGGGRPRRTG